MTEFTNETKLTNPAKKFISFKGTTGKWVYWDKEKEANIEVPAPKDFIILDELSTIKGFHDASQSGIYSNEVRDTTKDTLWVRTFKGKEIDTGIYRDIKGNLQGGKYAKSVYAYMNGELVNFQFVGISLSAWIEKGFTTRNVRISDEMEKGKKGTNEYFIPKFEQVEPNQETMAKAKVKFDEIQKYLNEKLRSDKSGDAEIEVEEFKTENETDTAFDESIDPDLDAILGG